jgi:hypothetical protein
MFWDISIFLCAVGILTILSMIGGTANWLFDFWHERIGDENIKWVLFFGLCLTLLGVAGLLIVVVLGCIAHSQGCLAG